jgi:nucleotide-binding universal stress UspA family protein
MSPVAPAVEVGLTTILVATDFSPSSVKPLRHALGLARHFGAKICLAHVVPPPGYAEAMSDITGVTTEAALRDATHLEEKLVESGALTGLRHEMIVCRGKIWNELEKIIDREHVDMIVVGTHGRKGWKKLALGSVAEDIFRHARCPTLTVGPGTPAETWQEAAPAARTILFATDFGAASEHALPYAISLANEQKAQLVLMHVVLPYVVENIGPYWYVANDMKEQQERAEASSLRRLHEMLAQGGVTEREPEFAVQFNLPADGILEAAANCKADLIVMGLNRTVLPGVSSHLPGTTAYDVVCRAVCPVLTIRS